MKTALAWVLCAAVAVAQSPSGEWLKRPASLAESIGRQAYVRGRVGGFFDVRLLKTERSYVWPASGPSAPPATPRRCW